jgi:DNA-binding HxlR family transcriptional regulator
MTGMEESLADLTFDVFARNCPSRPTFEHITGRWGSLVLMALGDGALRFGMLRRRVDGVSEKMLSQTLQALERDGFVLRDVVTTIPPRVEYSLTPLGVETARRMRDLIDFLEARMLEVLQAQEHYDNAKAHG